MNASLLALLLLAAPAFAQSSDAWKDFAPLLGSWTADVDPLGSTGSFTLARDLQGQVLVRKSHAEYPPGHGRPAQHHQDLMVIFHQGEQTRASYWDNEGHAIDYGVTIEKGTFTFVSVPVPNQPRFRLTYVLTGKNALALRFELARPGAPEQFAPYLKATLHRAR